MVKYRANSEIFEMSNYALKKILDTLIEGETDFETVKKRNQIAICIVKICAICTPINLTSTSNKF